jgi:putative SOS response-associated peptidase YedK
MVSFMAHPEQATMKFVREIHTRMPVILPDEHHDSWLSGEAGKEV